MKQIRVWIWIILLTLAAVTLHAETVISLAGQWHFALDRRDVGISERWFDRHLPDKIHLPGALEAQGCGDPIGIHTPWVLTLYDHFWYLRADYAAYTNAGHVQVPFLCQPPRHYLGAAWYQCQIQIPNDWAGQRVVLFLERPHWKTTVWLDDREIGSDLSLCAPHEYPLGFVTPGRHRLTIRVDNRLILPYRPDAHSVSDSLDDAWNGIVGKIELRATPPVWLDDVQVYPKAAQKTARVKIQIGNATGKAGRGRMELMVRLHPPHTSRFAGAIQVVMATNVTWSVSGGAADIEIPLGAQAETWDEFHPTLYELSVSLAAAGARPDTRCVGFGLRDFRAAGSQFILNGRPIYFRGTHFGGDFPLTGYPATDVASWRKIFQTCKCYGLNHVRFHSWCPPEAAFEAADELGIYLQIECGMWNTFSPGDEMEKQLYAETVRVLRDFGNHPSLMLVSASNEAHGNWKPVLSRWVKHFRAQDLRHLYTPDTGWSLIDSPEEPLRGGADYLAIARIGPNHVRGPDGWFGRDYHQAIAGVPVPVIAHEVGQWCAYPNFDIIKKFTGFMRPGNFEIFRDSAKAHGVLADDARFAWASGRFQLECYKEEIEANLRTPGLEGFQLLDLHDYTGQGTALVGLLDPFWENKGYVSPAEFRKFCNSVVLLARLTNRVWTTAEHLEAPVEAANFGPAPLPNTPVLWKIVNSSNDVVAGGRLGSYAIPLGKNFPLGVVSMDLSRLPAPAAYQLVVELQSPHVSNDWNFWLYPAQISDAVPTNVLVTASWEDAEKRLAAGGRVLFLPPNADLTWDSPPLSRTPIFWNALMGPTWTRFLGLWCDTRSPALAEFPTGPNCDWQWTSLFQNVRAVNLDRLPRRLQPIVSAIDDWNRNYKLGVIFEARVGKGRLLVCSIDLNHDSRPVAQQLRRSLLDYMAGNRFHPATKISPAQFAGLYFDTRIMRELGATALADGRPADEILDGDPNTFWSSADARGRGPKPPHNILISFPHPVPMNGLVLMNRQNQREHLGDIREYELAAGDDGIHWFPVVRGQLASTWNPQKILFPRTLTAKRLRLTALSGFGNDTSAALAELAVIYAGPKRVEKNSPRMEYQKLPTASPDIDAGDSKTRQPPTPGG